VGLLEGSRVSIETVADLTQIRRYARGALKAAGVTDRAPTPLDEVAQAIGLNTPEDLFELGEEVPPGLLSAIRRLRQKALGALATSERTVYLDFSLPLARRRFTLAHEIGHEALPWHCAAYLGDDVTTLAFDMRELLEIEANVFAADLVFGLDRFTTECDSFAPGIGVPLGLNEGYQASAHAALRRYVERSQHRLGLLVLGRYPVTLDGASALKVMADQCTQSESFGDRWGAVSAIFPDRLAIGSEPALQIAIDLDCGVGDAPVDLWASDTKRGRMRFQSEVLVASARVVCVRPGVGRGVVV
jgi:IrrE N-terminal-like domain